MVSMQSVMTLIDKIKGAISGWRMGQNRITRCPVTGTMVRQYFEYFELDALVERSRRLHSNRIVLVWGDVDNLKLVNDTLGNNAGDLLLSLTGQAFCNSFPAKKRAYDLVVRTGGDEFLAVLMGASVEFATTFQMRVQTGLLEKLQNREVQEQIRLVNPSLSAELIRTTLNQVSISTAVREWHHYHESWEQAWAMVDMEMKANKRKRKLWRNSESPQNEFTPQLA